jgi:hypothetical protein
MMAVFMPDKYKKKMVLAVPGAKEIDGKTFLAVDRATLSRDGDNFTLKLYHEGMELLIHPFKLRDGEEAVANDIGGYLEVELL